MTVTQGIQVHCGHCGEQLLIHPKYAGTRGRCKRCGGIVFIPKINEVPQIPSPSAIDTVTSTLIECEKCGGKMVRAKIRSSLGCLESLFIIFLFPYSLLYLFFVWLPNSKKKRVWKCSSCGYFFEYHQERRTAWAYLLVILLLWIIFSSIIVAYVISSREETYDRLKLNRTEPSVIQSNSQDMEREDGGDVRVEVGDSVIQSNSQDMKQPPVQTVLSPDHQELLYYYLSTALLHYSEAERLNNNIQESGVAGNTRLMKRAKEEQHKAEEAKQAWLSIMRSAYPNWTPDQIEHVWLEEYKKLVQQYTP